MGIQGLIPFLEKSSRQINISQYAGCTVAIDAYCWLHKGAFSCADKLARGDKTTAYVNYCMKYVNMLLSHNIKPILVFDGRHLPAKADTEKKRRQNREVNRRRAAELLRQDKPNEARTFLQRCIDVTHAMALELMRECRRRNVDCITAPYEADAQLAFLNIANIAHIVITEDSDLLLFGCTKVLFKLDLNGNGLLVEQDDLHLAMGVTKGCFSFDKFRHMCILSGCDYLPSLPKIGLAKACRFVKSTVDPDIHRALSRLGGHLNMNIAVPLEYRDKFVGAEAMFRHQPVFDPLTRQLVPLTPFPSGAPSLPLLSQEKLSSDQLLQLALGNLDPFTLEKVDNWSPDNAQLTGGRTNSWDVKAIAPHKSIWSADYKPRALVIERPDPCDVKRTSTSGRVVERDVPKLKLPVKRPAESVDEDTTGARQPFDTSPHPSKKRRYDDEDILDLLDKSDQSPHKTEPETGDPKLLESPKKCRGNPFTKATPPSGNKFSGLAKLAQFRKTSVSPSDVVQSRYFNGNNTVQATVKLEDTTPAVNTIKTEDSTPAVNTVKSEDSKTDVKTLKDVSNLMENQTTNTDNSHNKEPVQRLSDSNIMAVIEEDINIKEDKDNLNSSNGKENFCRDDTKTKRENTFNWRPSLEEMFGFKSKFLSSSPAVRKDFVNPTNDKVDEETKSKIQENQIHKRNPFAKAKITQVEECLGSQGSSLNSYSQTDSLTPDSISKEDSPDPAPSRTPAVRVTPKPQMKIGLSKKQPGGCQKSLLSMFAFKPKPRLQR